MTIALVGDYDPTVTAHKAIPKALELAGRVVGVHFNWTWVDSVTIASKISAIKDFDAFWVVPASPYVNMEGVLSVIRFARENRRPFLGTCGGYQHALLEYARSVLGFSNAGNAEVDAHCTMPLISALTCPLVETETQIEIRRGSKLAAFLGMDRITEGFRCSYGLNQNTSRFSTVPDWHLPEKTSTEHLALSNWRIIRFLLEPHSNRKDRL